MSEEKQEQGCPVHDHNIKPYKKLYSDAIRDALDSVKEEGRYRVFADIARKQGDFPEACHYKDGSEAHNVASPKSCPKKSPKTGVPFAAWHPTLATVHVWAWYPNPAGVFKSHNMMLAPFNKN